MRTLKRANGLIEGGPLTKVTDIKKSADTAIILDGGELLDGKPGRIAPAT